MTVTEENGQVVVKGTAYEIELMARGLRDLEFLRFEIQESRKTAH